MSERCQQCMIMGKQHAVSIVRVADAAAIAMVAGLAADVWPRHYTPIIGKAQVDYMLDRFQSAPAIARQIAEEGYAYFIAMDSGAPAGYLALVPDVPRRTALLSKLYVLPERQRRGVGRAMMDFVAATCREAGIRELWLTVNRNNRVAVDFYSSMGFRISDPLVQDIGGGFVMDDYRMTKEMPQHGP